MPHIANVKYTGLDSCMQCTMVRGWRLTSASWNRGDCMQLLGKSGELGWERPHTLKARTRWQKSSFRNTSILQKIFHSHVWCNACWPTNNHHVLVAHTAGEATLVLINQSNLIKVGGIKLLPSWYLVLITAWHTIALFILHEHINLINKVFAREGNTKKLIKGQRLTINQRVLCPRKVLLRLSNSTCCILMSLKWIA